jgi:hypothetical protein
MVQIDIPVSKSLQDALDIDPCSVVKLPLPTPLKVELPMGGSLNGLVDMSKGIPNDCSMTFSLLLQLAPLMAAIECPLRMLKLLKPLVEIIKGLPGPPSPSLLSDFAEAAFELAECFLVFAKIPAFIRDVLCLIRAVLNCLITQLTSVRDVMNGLSLRIGEAQGNPDLLATLNCAQQNANTSAQALTQAIDPIAAIIALIQPIAEIGGVNLNLSLSTPSAPPQDVAALNDLINILQGVVDAIDEITSALPGGSCGG